ncbi:hypothetical protein T484DRAFT_1844669, partial [Baffinella frigidus]
LLDLAEFKRMHEELEEVKNAVLQEEDSQWMHEELEEFENAVLQEGDSQVGCLFRALDRQHKGEISIDDLAHFFPPEGVKPSEEQLRL